MSKFIIPIVIGILVGGALRAADVPPAAGAVLARVALTGPVTDLRLPIYARLRDAQGREYVLVVATAERLAAAGQPYVVLDTDARAPDYLLARPGRRRGAQPAVAPNLRVVHDDGAQWVARATLDEAEALAAAGFELQRLGPSPVAWTPPGAPAGRPAAGRVAPLADWNPAVAKFMGEVAEARLLTQLRELAGEQAVTIGGESYTIQTRNSGSGEPIAKATQFGYESFAALGLDVQYHQWAWGRNVIATRPGGTLANEIVLIVAHLDDEPGGTVAPGADDNASGSVGVLTAARILSQCHFARTVRFALVTGEEQGLLGSQQYAADAAAAGDQIVAVLNLDMIAWDALGGPVLRLHTRTATDPGYASDLAIAETFTNVVTVYGLASWLTPVINADGPGYSDHASFWAYGYPAIIAIEDDDADFNDYYHSVNDTIAHVNAGYFTAFVRAAVGTVAQLAGPVEGALPIYQTVAVGDQAGGNGDGIPNPGETVDLTVTLLNAGTQTATAVAATIALSAADPYVTITDDALTFGDLLAGQPTAALDPGTIVLASDCPTPHDITLELALADSGGNHWTAQFTLTVANRSPAISSPAWADPNPVTLPAGSAVHVGASDPDGDPLTYAWTQEGGVGTATFAAPTAADSGVSFSAAGAYLLRVTVSDGKGGSVTSDVSVTVNPGSGVDPRADVNHDGVINALDLQIVIANFGQTVGNPGCDARADANADGVVNALDLQIVIANFGQTVP